jgi:ankyrin repeat protein
MDRIRQLVNANPDAVKFRTEYSGQIPLHAACGAFEIGGGWSPEVIQYLVDQWPESVKVASNSGDLPLHRACSNQALLAVVQYLVEQWPESVKRADNYGWLPLHYACTNQTPLAVVQYLVEQWPESVQHRTARGKTPLDIANLPVAQADIDVTNWLSLPWRDRHNT